MVESPAIIGTYAPCTTPNACHVGLVSNDKTSKDTPTAHSDEQIHAIISKIIRRALS